MIVNDVSYAIYIKSSRTQVGGYEYVVRFVVEHGNSFFAVDLFKGAVIYSGCNVILFKISVDTVDRFAIVGKNYCFLVVEREQKQTQSIEFILRRRFGTPHLHARTSFGVFVEKIEHCGVVKIDKIRHFVNHSSRSEYFSAYVRHILYDFLHFLVKPEFERLIEFVENQDTSGIEVDISAFNVVDKASGSAYQDRRDHSERLLLIEHTMSAVAATYFV